MASDMLEHKEQASGDSAGKAPAGKASQGMGQMLQGRLTRGFNTFVLEHAGSRRLFKYAVLHHQGRRSGRTYATPTSARPTPDGFVVPIAFGKQTDWLRNVQTAGGCVIEWEGKAYPLVEPEVVDVAAVRSVFSPVERLFLPIFGAKQFVRLRHAPLPNSTGDM
jgi:deazaflavin-dependent oxidoreductase (nitroreductase family)